MGKTFSFKESMNMVSAVSGSYVTRKEVMEYFYKKFEEDKQFEPEELKQVVKELVTGKQRITPTMDQNKWNPNSIPNRRGRPKKEGEER